MIHVCFCQHIASNISTINLVFDVEPTSSYLSIKDDIFVSFH